MFTYIFAISQSSGVLRIIVLKEIVYYTDYDLQ